MYERSYSSHIHPPGATRSEKMKDTKESQKKINLRKAITELTILMNANFVPGDYHITLTYERDKRAETVEEAKRDRKIFLDRLRRRMKKEKEICKYIVVTEVGVRGALHHHMVMNQVPVEWIRQAWKHGRIDIRPLDDTGPSLDKKQKSFSAGDKKENSKKQRIFSGGAGYKKRLLAR